jgi:hypothetical protein
VDESDIEDDHGRGSKRARERWQGEGQAPSLPLFDRPVPPLRASETRANLAPRSGAKAGKLLRPACLGNPSIQAVASDAVGQAELEACRRLPGGIGSPQPGRSSW